MPKKSNNILALLAIAAGAYYIYTKMQTATPASNPGNGGNGASAADAGTDNGLMHPGNKWFPVFNPKLSFNKPDQQPDFIIKYKLGACPHTL